MEKLKYVLVTRNRPGQRQAIEWLPVATHRSQLSLLIEFDRQDSAEREAELLATAAQGARRVFADVERLESGRRSLVLNKLREEVTEVVPVHVLRAGCNGPLGVEVGEEGLCLRVQAGPRISGDRVDDRLGWLIGDGLRPSDIDLIWDLGSLHSAGSVELLAAHTIQQLKRVSFLPGLRSVTIAGGSIPQEAWKYGKNTAAKIHRIESQLVPVVAAEFKGAGVVISRGDYGTRCPETGAVAPFGQPTPALYYSKADCTYLFRGNKIDHKGLQAAVLAKKLTSEAFFRGGQFSTGDYLLEEWAKGGVGPGQTANLIAVSLNHHISEELNRS